MSDPRIRSSGSRKSMEEDRRRHRECLRVLDELEICVDRRPDRGAGWIGRLQSCFATFADALRLQFESEERGTLYRDLPETKPRLSDRIEALREEHERLLVELDAAVLRVAALNDERFADAGQVRETVRDLIAKLRLHEANETRLLQSAYWREVGTGD